MNADAVRAATLEMGYEKLRGEQQAVIQSYVRGRDTFVSEHSTTIDSRGCRVQAAPNHLHAGNEV